MGTVHAVRGDEMPAGPPTPGMTRKKAALGENVVVVETDIGPQATSTWHHHGDYTAYVCVLRGGLRVEWGPGGRESLELQRGDFYVVEPHTVHRESTSGSSGSQERAVVAGFGIGSGSWATNVEGPPSED